jgi:hypothetical protein
VELHLHSAINFYEWYQIKEDEMGRACSTNGGGGMHIGYWWGSQKERDH